MEGSVRKKGGRWYYCFDVGSVDGKRKRVERAGGRTKAEAQKALREALNEFEKTGSTINDSNISVSDYLDYWMDNYVMINLKYNTQENYRRMINLHIKPHIGIYQLKKITPGTIQDLVNLKFQEGFAKQTLSIMIGILQKSFKMAVYPWKLISDNPVQYIERPKYYTVQTDKEQLKIISLETFEDILKVAPTSNNFHVALQIGFHTGLRVSEVCGLTWDCVDLDKREIKVEKILLKKNGEWIYGTPKTSSSDRKVKFGDTLFDVLRKQKVHQMENKLIYGQHYIDNNHVCTKDSGEFVTTDSAKSATRLISNKLGIQFNFHSLRHTHLTMLIEMGALMKDVQKRAGHSRESVTSDKYIHLTEDMKNKTVDLFEQGLAKLKSK